MRAMIRKHATLAGYCLLLAWQPTLASSQESGQGSYSVLLVATTLPPNAPAVAVLRKDGEPRAIVMVDVGLATPEHVKAALRTLAVLRLQFSDHASGDLRAVPRNAGRPTVMSASERRWLAGLLSDLRKVPARHVQGIGSRRALVLLQPPLRLATVAR